MNRIYVYLLGSVLAVSAAAAHGAEPSVARLATDASAPLTLTSAKQIVDQSLRDNGERQFRAGRAEFDGQGNVLVEIVSFQGLPYRHVLVDGHTHQLLAAKARTVKAG